MIDSRYLRKGFNVSMSVCWPGSVVTRYLLLRLLGESGEDVYHASESLGLVIELILEYVRHISVILVRRVGKRVDGEQLLLRHTVNCVSRTRYLSARVEKRNVQFG
jgi:hypothetical protein